MWYSRLAAFVRRMRSPRTAERNLNDDIESYADQLADELRASGVPDGEAHRRARAMMGGIEPTKELVREARAGAWLEQTWRDLTQSLRSLRRAPGFAATAILTIGLGIGVNTTIFSVINSALLKPVPYQRPEELVDLGHQVTSGRGKGITRVGIDWSEIRQWRAERAIFQGLECYKPASPRQWAEQDISLRVGALTPGLPALLGVLPLRGRMFTVEEADAGADLIVIAESLWTQSFGRRPDAIGQTMTIDNRRLTVIGILPAAFRFGPGGAGRVAAWTPLAERAVPGVPGSGLASSVFRLRTGLTPEAATPMADVVARRMQIDKPPDEPWTPELMPVLASRASTEASFRSPMFLLLAAAGLVLLVACANVANLLLTRGATRREELAMRAALGASRGRIARLLLAEGLLLAIVGGIAAVVMARWSLGAVTSLIPPRLAGGLFAVGTPELDWRVALFALGVTATVALLSAVWPAVDLSRHTERQSIGQGRQTVGLTRDRRRVTRGLQAAQVATALVLAVAAGLFATSFARLLNTDLGFDTRGLATVSYSFPNGRYQTDESQYAAVADILERVRATPGVGQAVIGASPAATGTSRFEVIGAEPIPGLSAAIRLVGAHYFETAGIRILAGRPLDDNDMATGALVTVIDEVDARRFFGRDSPLGRKFTYSPYVGPVEIVGVASHVETTDLGSGSGSRRVGLYLLADRSMRSVLVRIDGDDAAVLKNIRATLAAFDSGIRINTAGAATEVFDTMETFAAPRFYVVLVSLFGVLALVTASVGLYGLLAHAVGQRQREIGVRVALGSTPGQIRWLVLKEALVPIATGLVLGAVASWWVAGLLGSFLFGGAPRDPLGFAVGTIALCLTAAAATVIPIHRATGVDPIISLRAE